MPAKIEIHWRRLRLSLAAFAAATLVGGTTAAAAWLHEQRITEGMEAAETRFAEAHGRYSSLAEEREKWRRYGPLYRRLARQGRLGGERPARWTEAVRRAGGRSPRRPLPGRFDARRRERRSGRGAGDRHVARARDAA